MRSLEPHLIRVSQQKRQWCLPGELQFHISICLYCDMNSFHSSEWANCLIFCATLTFSPGTFFSVDSTYFRWKRTWDWRMPPISAPSPRVSLNNLICITELFERARTLRKGWTGNAGRQGRLRSSVSGIRSKNLIGLHRVYSERVKSFVLAIIV